MTDNDIRGTVTDAQGDPIQGATVSLFLADQASAVRETTTDSNGEYIFDLHPDGTGSSEDWHVAVSYTDANGTQNALSKPFVSASLPDFTFPVAASNLVAWYPFDPSEGARDQTGGVAGVGDPKDYSGTVNGATYQANGGVVDINSGSGSGAYDFEYSGSGSSDHINIGDPILSDGQSSFSISCWVYANSYTNDYMRAVASHDGSDGFWFGPDDDGIDRWDFNWRDVNGSNANTEATNINFGTGEWAHFVGTYDGSNATLYQNRSVIESSSGNAPMSNSNNPVQISGSFNYGEEWDGKIDDVRFYNRALTESEINQIFQNTAPDQIFASGGTTVTTETIGGDDYRIHAFENTGSDTFTVNYAPSGATVDALVVGGGGGTGTNQCGGAGGGEVVFSENIAANTTNVTVGDGGNDFNNGGISSFGNIDANGGAPGATRDSDGPDGGSSGGDSRDDNTQGGGISKLSEGFGNVGGDATGTTWGGAGGGGGASQPGFDGGGTGSEGGEFSGDGGDGVDFSAEFGTEFGENGVFGGGGGGSAHGPDSISDVGVGGLGGGGRGGKEDETRGGSFTVTATGGTDGTGGGSGGVFDDSDNVNYTTLPSGGSGIVLIRYRV